MFELLRKNISQIEEEVIDEKPVTKKEIEDMIKLINAAHNVDAMFDLQLKLVIGDFNISSESYTGMKLLSKTKSDDDRLVISYKNALLSNDTVIDISNILHIILYIKFCDKPKNSDDNEEQ